MGLLNHIGDPSHTVTPAISDLVRRLGEVVLDDPSDTWACRVAEGPHGFSVRMDHAPVAGSVGRRAALAYECDGSADAIVKDFRSWLASQPVTPA